MYLKQQTVYIYLSVVVRVPVESNKIGIGCFSAMYAALNSKIKDWLVRHQDNMSEWNDLHLPVD